MTEHKKERLLSTIEHVAAEFINRESNRKSLITVTRSSFREDGKTINIYISVMPDHETGAAVDFLSRQGDAFFAFLKKKIKTHALPRVFFLADPNISGLEQGPVT